MRVDGGVDRKSGCPHPQPATAGAPMVRCLAAGALALMLFAACGKGIDCTPVPTPGGYVARDCGIEVPNGATVSETGAGTIAGTVDGGVVATYPPCPCPPP